ncbi:MAG: peptidoglycan-binding protein [bacterium]|nr:peptidoglycan-binding protein [bacterium]
MPRRIDDDEELPRRRRGAKAVAIQPEPERGLLMRALLHSPKDMVAGLLAMTAVGAIVANALFLQAGRHPSPMFGSVVTLPAPQLASVPSPRPRPAELAARPVEPEPVEARPEPRAADIKTGSDVRGGDPMTNLVVKSTSVPTPANVMRPPAPIPATAQSAGARRVAAVQRTLTQYGYGQLKATGAVGADTQAAISKFEKERKLPVTGQMSDRLVRELTAMVGHPID